jgi:vacuolar-type H+-ATPase subunit D/Vma8
VIDGLSRSSSFVVPRTTATKTRVVFEKDVGIGTVSTYEHRVEFELRSLLPIVNSFDDSVIPNAFVKIEDISVSIIVQVTNKVEKVC